MNAQYSDSNMPPYTIVIEFHTLTRHLRLLLSQVTPANLLLVSALAFLAVSIPSPPAVRLRLLDVAGRGGGYAVMHTFKAALYLVKRSAFDSSAR